MDFETRLGFRGPNQGDDDLIAFQRLTAPGPGDVTEDPMFDFIPLTRTGGKVTDFDRHVQLVGELLQFVFP
jgi:hypothetical protein